VRLPLNSTSGLPNHDHHHRGATDDDPTGRTRSAHSALTGSPVQKSQPTTPDKCPATNPNAPAAPINVLITYDLARTTLYTLGPEAMQLGLTHVDPPSR
jgi:hypothetical protein